METITAESRTVFGKSLKSLRSSGILPAVVYGKGKETQSISIKELDFMKVLKTSGESSIIKLKIGSDEQSTLIHDVAFDPISNRPMHVDFYIVDMKEKVQVDVPLEFENEETVVKTGGLLVKVMHELSVEALPGDLPHLIKVDISVLKAPGDAIVVRDLKAPHGVNILNNPEDMIAHIEEMRSETAEAAAEVQAQSIEDIEVVGKKGKTEETESEEKPEEA